MFKSYGYIFSRPVQRNPYKLLVKERIVYTASIQFNGIKILIKKKRQAFDEKNAFKEIR